MGKSISKITFFFLAAVFLIISTMAIGDIYCKQLPDNAELFINNPNNPITLYHYPNFFVKDDVLYFDDYNDHILMMDVEDVNNIKIIGEFNTHSYRELLNLDSYIIGIRHGDNFSYGFYEYTLEILSIMNDSEIALQGQMTFVVDDHFFNPKMRIFTDNKDNIFCSLDMRDKRAIYLIDCTNPTAPYMATNYSKEILELEGEDFIRNYKFHENYLYALIADSDNFNCTISTYNITNPLTPVKINDLDFPTDYDLDDFYFDESAIYCKYHTNEYTQHNLAIYDINNRSNPQLIVEINNIAKVNSIVFQGDYVYLNDWTSIQIYEKKADKTLEYKKEFQPEIKVNLHDGLDRGKLYGEMIFYSRLSVEPARTFTIINIQDPLNPVEIQVFGPATNQVSIEFNWMIAEIFLVSILVLITKKKKRFLR
ncbi:MAG: hypothetical protein GNW80_06985 [Asgard group archaeon]|nr:hypothetical protein [Asgard group archaeon]